MEPEDLVGAAALEWALMRIDELEEINEDLKKDIDFYSKALREQEARARDARISSPGVTSWQQTWENGAQRMWSNGTSTNFSWVDPKQAEHEERMKSLGEQAHLAATANFKFAADSEDMKSALSRIMKKMEDRNETT